MIHITVYNNKNQINIDIHKMYTQIYTVYIKVYSPCSSFSKNIVEHIHLCQEFDVI